MYDKVKETLLQIVHLFSQIVGTKCEGVLFHLHCSRHDQTKPVPQRLPKRSA